MVCLRCPLVIQIHLHLQKEDPYLYIDKVDFILLERPLQCRYEPAMY